MVANSGAPVIQPLRPQSRGLRARDSPVLSAASGRDAADSSSFSIRRKRSPITGASFAVFWAAVALSAALTTVCDGEEGDARTVRSGLTVVGRDPSDSRGPLESPGQGAGSPSWNGVKTHLAPRRTQGAQGLRWSHLTFRRRHSRQESAGLRRRRTPSVSIEPDSEPLGRGL